jgi:hypothetical protein
MTTSIENGKSALKNNIPRQKINLDAAAGYTAYALDVRGYGESGARGYIAYVG